MGHWNCIQRVYGYLQHDPDTDECYADVETDGEYSEVEIEVESESEKS